VSWHQHGVTLCANDTNCSCGLPPHEKMIPGQHFTRCELLFPLPYGRICGYRMVPSAHNAMCTRQHEC
jgi:hypothetical protein